MATQRLKSSAGPGRIATGCLGLCLLALRAGSPAQASAAEAPAAAPPGAAAAPEAASVSTPGPTVAVQAGISGAATTAEAESGVRWGLVAGAGIHGGRFTPVGPTARLAYDHILTGRLHVRAGLRLYSFAESGPDWSCDPCAFLVPEIGVRFVGTSGFVFELAEPLGRFNLTHPNGFFAGGSASLLVSVLVGYAHRF